MKEHLRREFGRASRGVKVADGKRGHDFHRVPIVAAVIHSKDGTKRLAPECYQGSMKAKRFENWFEFTLLKNIENGMTVIMDNASFHCKKKIAACWDITGIKRLKKTRTRVRR
jgi:hypothetical protein